MWYLHGDKETINRISDNFQLVLYPIRNGFYVLSILHKTPFAGLTQKYKFFKTWHRQLAYPNWVNMKHFANAQGIDMAKVREVDKRHLVCKIYILAKQKRKSSYKTSSQPADICKILYMDLMGLITPIGWNSCSYALTVTNRYLRCCWVEKLNEKREAGLALKRFVIFIKNQKGKTVKSIGLNQRCKFQVWDLEFWTKDKCIKVEYIFTYSSKINGIAEWTNCLIAGKARCLLLDVEWEINKSFWSESFLLIGLPLLFYNLTAYYQFGWENIILPKMIISKILLT